MMQKGKSQEGVSISTCPPLISAAGFPAVEAGSSGPPASAPPSLSGPAPPALPTSPSAAAVHSTCRRTSYFRYTSSAAQT